MSGTSPYRRTGFPSSGASPARRRSGRRARLRAWTFLPVLIALFTGCGRAHYRVQADQDAYGLVAQKATDPRWPLENFTINVDPRSRMYDGDNPDFPPMPPDDPTAHRLMHCVDCMKGYPCWHKNGDTPFVQNPLWLSYLPLSEDGSLTLTSDGAVKLALINSPDYQQELQNLYLSALDVSFERFRFDSQFFAGYGASYTTDGPLRPGSGGESQSVIELATVPGARGIRMQKLFPAGGELVVGLANSLIWQLSGPNTHDATTLLDFTLVQPLLRGAGRDRVLERLTVSERTLLSNVRQMERFRRGFYLEITTGRNAGQGPTRRGGVFGGSGLEGFTGVGAGGFGRVGGGGQAPTSGGAGAEQAGGYLGLLQAQLDIANQESNVASLRSSLAQLESFFQAGRIDYFQVELARQALYEAQSRLLNSRTLYEATLDQYKQDLGVPPQLDIRIRDDMLEQFKLIDPEIVPLQEQLTSLQEELGDEILEALPQGVDVEPLQWNPALIDRLTDIKSRLDVFRAIQSELLERNVPRANDDVRRLRERVPDRLRELDRLAEQVSGSGLNLDRKILDAGRLEELPDQLDREIADLKRRFASNLQEVERIEARLDNILATGATLDSDELANRLRLEVLVIPNELMEMSAQVLELILVQARARTESITLVSVELDSDVAIDIARVNRRDWMNARTSLVDSWRLIAFNANDLESVLDVVFSGDISNVGDNPLRLRDATGRLRVGVEFDAPLTRLAERNLYRQSLIEYQDARRNYYQFEDAVARGLRNTLRTIDLHQLNFELRRAAIFVAVAQVELARLRLQEPPRPNEEQVFGATTARDLVQALTDLLNVQNDFISVWVNYEVQRRSLDFDLGTMRLNDEGLWIDPGPVGGEHGLPGSENLDVNPDYRLDPSVSPELEILPPPTGLEEAFTP